MATEVAAGARGGGWGGNTQGFPTKRAVLARGSVLLLLSKGVLVIDQGDWKGEVQIYTKCIVGESESIAVSLKRMISTTSESP